MQPVSPRTRSEAESRSNESCPTLSERLVYGSTRPGQTGNDVRSDLHSRDTQDAAPSSPRSVRFKSSSSLMLYNHYFVYLPTTVIFSLLEWDGYCWWRDLVRLLSPDVHSWHLQGSSRQNYWQCSYSCDLYNAMAGEPQCYEALAQSWHYAPHVRCHRHDCVPRHQKAGGFNSQLGLHGQ